MKKVLAGVTGATALCLLLAVAIDKTPSVLVQKKGLACGR